MDDSLVQIEYNKTKYKIKKWENNFKMKFGRIPSKHDIREAHPEIINAYKTYQNIKTTMLRKSQSDLFTNDENLDSSSVNLSQSESIFSSQNSFTWSQSTTEFSNLKQLRRDNVQISNIINVNEDHAILDFEAEKVNKVNEKAWGSNLLTSKIVDNKKEEEKISPPKPLLKPSINAKLFENSSFNKRNPRKSLSRAKSTISLNSSESSQSGITDIFKESLPDFETVLIQKSQQKSNDISLRRLCSKQDLMTNIDQGWLERCDHLNNLEKSSVRFYSSDNLSHLESSQTKYGIRNLPLMENQGNNSLVNASSSLGLSKLNLKSPTEETSTFRVSKFDKNDISDSDGSVVENSEDESADQKSIRHILKKRRVFDVLHKKQSATVEKEIVNKTENVVLDEIPSTIIENVSPEVEKKTRAFKVKPMKSRIKTETTIKPIRNARSPGTNVNYKEYDSEAESEKDPFADAENTDEDADYKPDSDDNTKTSAKRSERPQKTKQKKERPAKAKKVLTRKKSVRRSKRKFDHENEESENSKPEMYLPSIDMEINNVPRIDTKELERSTAVFENFVKTSSSKITVAKSQANIQSLNFEFKENIAKEKLLKKVGAGNLNENFLRLNLRKKVFVRGKKTVNFSRYKKAQWKKKKVANALAGPEMDMRGCDGGLLICFQCGGVGHFAQNCKIKGDNLLPINADDTELSPYPTLEEAAQMAKDKVLIVHSRNPDKLPSSQNLPITNCDENSGELDDIFESDDIFAEQSDEIQESLKTYIPHKIPDDFLKKCGFHELSVGNDDKVTPLYSVNPDGSLPETPREVFDALRLFGHKSFRYGQEKAIMRILTGLSTLVTLSTGSGKSLCYQLPAYLYAKKRKCVTLVVSPLVSLMEDQVHGVPTFLNAQCLHTNLTPKSKNLIIEMIKSGNIDILLMSPEAVVAGEKSTGFGQLLKQLPPIAFVCIDEAHCVSQWSHNFRPSYLMICRVLKEKLGISTILGLTATATAQTRESIINHLKVPDGVNGIISDIPLPDNLILTVSKDENRDIALLRLLKSDRFRNCHSIIIYCTRRDECERIATFIRTCFQDTKPDENRASTKIGSTKRKRLNWIAEPYHAGMGASRRKSIQNAFMKTELRIVVATIAFGMGINKSDIRAVIHYNLPKSYESYVQEVGRAGRDGQLAHCHLFLDAKGSDKTELRRHIFANSIDRHVIRKLLQNIFIPCVCGKTEKINSPSSSKSSVAVIMKKRNCPGHEVGFSIESTVQALDIPEENISTLLCYLELHETNYIQVLSKAYLMCKVLSYGGPRQLRLAAQTCPPLAMAIALDLKKGKSHDDSTIIEFPVIEIAAAIGWDSGVVKFQLKNLEWISVNGSPKRSTISVTFYDLGFRVRAVGNLSDEELDDTLDLLYGRVSKQEKAEIIQLQSVFEGLSSVSFPSCLQVTSDEVPLEPSNKIKQIIRDYFQKDITDEIELKDEPDNTSDQQLVQDIHTMISRYPENNFTGRALARIFHGVQSPNYPAVIWGRCKYWRAHTKANFNRIVALANSEIVKLRT